MTLNMLKVGSGSPPIGDIKTPSFGQNMCNPSADESDLSQDPRVCFLLRSGDKAHCVGQTCDKKEAGCTGSLWAWATGAGKKCWTEVVTLFLYNVPSSTRQLALLNEDGGLASGPSEFGSQNESPNHTPGSESLNRTKKQKNWAVDINIKKTSTKTSAKT